MSGCHHVTNVQCIRDTVIVKKIKIKINCDSESLTYQSIINGTAIFLCSINWLGNS